MKYLSILIIVLIPLAVIFTNLSFLALNYNFYLKIYKQQSINSNFNNDEILKDETKNLLGYFRGKNMLDYNFYSNQAILHLKDVKQLLNMVNILAFVLTSLVLVLSVYVFISKKEVKQLLNAYAVGALATIILTTVFSAIMILDFENSFTVFHTVLFRNNYWLFGANDNLLNMFPQRFFVSFANYLLANIIVSALLILLVVFSFKKIHAKPGA